MKLTNRDDRRRLAYLAAAGASFIFIAGMTLARGEELHRYRFNLYVADRGAGVPAMHFKLQVGGVGLLGECYALGAIAIDSLNQRYPNKDFMGGCQSGEMLTLRELVGRADELLPNDGDSK